MNQSGRDDAPGDPVLVRRERIRRLTELGQRLGYLAFGLAVAAFVFGFVAGFTDPLVTAITAAIVVGSCILAPSIVLAYAVKAADKEDGGEPAN